MEERILDLMREVGFIKKHLSDDSSSWYEHIFQFDKAQIEIVIDDPLIFVQTVANHTTLELYRDKLTFENLTRILTIWGQI